MRLLSVTASVSCALILSASSAQAQLHVFDLNQAASAFTWTATTNFGSVQGNPSNTFELQGTVDVQLTGTMPTTAGQFISGDALVVPDISGILPNPVPLLPPLATVDISNMRLSATSPQFAVVAGAFTTDVTVVITQGDLDVTALGNTTTTDLTGNSSLPTPSNGTLVRVMDTITIDVPVSLLFPIGFMSPIGMITGNISLDGTVNGSTTAIDDPSVGISFCNGDGGDQMGCTDCPCANNAPVGTVGGCLNQSGNSAQLQASGSPSVSAADPTDLRFEMVGGNPNTLAVLTSGDNLAPQNAANPCFGLGSGLQSAVLDGLRCAVGATQRHGGRPMDANGDVGVTNNGWGGASGPAPSLATQGGFVAGQTRYFQVFYRADVALSCGTGQNTTQAVQIVFGP